MTDVPSSYLVVPDAGDKSIPQLYRRVRTIALGMLLRRPLHDLGPAVRRAVLGVRPQLTRLLRTHKAWILDAVGHPDVLTPLLVLAVGTEVTGQRADDLFAAAVPPMLAQLAHAVKKGVITEAILWDLPVPELVDDTTFRRVRFEPPARGVLVDPLGLELNLHDETKLRVPGGASFPDGGTGDRPFHPIRRDLPRLRLSMHDSNPLSMFEAHPDKDGNAISLGDKPVEHWLDAIRQALELIELTLPTWFAELRGSMRRFVPVGYLPERHLSATYREAPGVAYLTLCDNPLTIAEAIVHETQHTKINLLSWVDPIVHNAHSCWTESPVRPDLRPLWGVLLAVHAFVPVAAMHARLAQLDHPITHTERFPRRRAEVLAGNHTGMVAVLNSADPSPIGKRLIDEMSALHNHLRTIAPPPPPGLDLDPNVLPPS